MGLKSSYERWTAPHSHGHAHGAQGPDGAHTRLPDPPSTRTARLITFAVLTVVVIATAIGFLRLWPDYSEVAKVAERAEYAATGVSYERGIVQRVAEGCGEESSAGVVDRGGSSAGACKTATVEILSGPDTGRVADIALRGSLAVAGLQAGDRVELVAMPVVEYGVEQGAEQGSDPGQSLDSNYAIHADYGVTGIQRHVPLLVLAIAFALVVVAVGRIRGFLALAALALSVVVLLAFVLPALVAGGPGLAIGIVSSTAIMLVTLYFVHGPTMRTTAALIGTLFGIACVAILATLSSHFARLSGIGGDASSLLSAMATEIDFRGLLTCSILIAGLGVLNDVTITQASAVWELRSAGPHLSRREIYRRAMRIGRDHIASTVYTVFFAYVGAALSVLILLYLYNRPLLSILTGEDIAIEIVSTLCGSIGLVLAVPITTWIAASFAPGPAEGDGADPVASPDPDPDPAGAAPSPSHTPAHAGPADSAPQVTVRLAPANAEAGPAAPPPLS